LVNNSVIQSGAQVLPNLTQQYLIEQEAEKRGIKLNDEVLDRERQAIVDDSGGESGFQDALTEFGIPEDYILSQIRTKQLLVEMVKDNIKVSDEDVQKYYEENKDTIDPQGTRGFENIKDLVRTELTEQLQEAEFSTLVQNLQESGQVETHLGNAQLT